MIRYRKALLGLAAAASVLTIASAGVAQDGPPRGDRPGAEGRGPGPGGAQRGNPEMQAQRLTERLAIRADQQAALNAFLTATQPRPLSPQAMQGLTAPQRLDRQLSELQRRADATKRFYAVLSPEQRQIFDQTPMAGGRGGRSGRGPGGRGGPGGPGGPNQGFGQQAPRY